MDFLIDMTFFLLGLIAGIGLMLVLKRLKEENDRQEAVHRAAEQRALSRLKRSESAKAAAERRKQGVSGKDIVQELVHPSSAGPAESGASLGVDESLYGRKGANDGLPH